MQYVIKGFRIEMSGHPLGVTEGKPALIMHVHAQCKINTRSAARLIEVSRDILNDVSK